MSSFQQETLSYAQKLFEDVTAYSSDVMRSLGNRHSLSHNHYKEYSWFMYPEEAQEWLKGMEFPATQLPFAPKQYTLNNIASKVRWWESITNSHSVQQVTIDFK